MVTPEILFLKQEDMIKAGLLDMKMVLEEVEKAFRLMGEGKVINPAKTMIGMPDNDHWDTFFMSMPVYVGGDVNVGGFKWAAESKFNQSVPGMPYGVDVVMLSDPHTVYPKAVMDGTLITAMRTSAAAGVAAKRLARKDSKIACLVGAGVIGRTMIMAMNEAVPSLEEIRIVDIDGQKAKDLAKEFEGKINVIGTDDLEGAAKDADLYVTETTAQKPFLKSEWVKSNATVIQMSFYEIEDKLIERADRVVVDNWVQLSHGAGTLINIMHSEGRLNREDVSELQEVVVGDQPGRQSDDELVVCCTFGIGSVDIVVADKVYETAKEMGVGQKLMLWDNPLWV